MNGKNMRLTLLLFAMLSYTGLQAQALQESFDASCNCWTVENHYDNGQVSSIHHENEARQRDGEALTYSAQGELIRKEEWSNGKLDGASQHYHPDGSLYMEAYYEKGKKVGTWKFLESDGTPTQEISYTGSGSDGVYAHYYGGVKYIKQTIENGKLIDTEILNQEIYNTVQTEAAQTEK